MKGAKSTNTYRTERLGESSQKTTMEGDYDLTLPGMDDMEQDLKELDADVASPAQRAASGDDAQWVSSPGSQGSKKQILARGERVSFSQSKKAGGRKPHEAHGDGGRMEKKDY